jgi:hypothetical protein
MLISPSILTEISPELEEDEEEDELRCCDSAIAATGSGELFLF